MLVPLLDRFESADPDAAGCLARDIADVLGGRRLFHGHHLGVLAWGLPHMGDVTTRSPDAKQLVASYIAQTLGLFEPRLEDVRIVPVEGAVDFSFRIEARHGPQRGQAVVLTLLSPFVGGALGAAVGVTDFPAQDRDEP